MRIRRIRKTDSLVGKYVLYEEQRWKIKEEGKDWLVISLGDRQVFCMKEDVDFDIPLKDDGGGVLLDW